MQVTAKRKSGGEVSANFDFGANLAEAVAKFGEEVVFKNFIASMKVGFQGWLRGQLDANKSQAEIDTAAAQWVPGERKASKSPQEKFRELFAALSPEERAKILKEHRAQAA